MNLLVSLVSWFFLHLSIVFCSKHFLLKFFELSFYPHYFYFLVLDQLVYFLISKLLCGLQICLVLVMIGIFDFKLLFLCWQKLAFFSMRGEYKRMLVLTVPYQKELLSSLDIIFPLEVFHKSPCIGALLILSLDPDPELILGILLFNILNFS